MFFATKNDITEVVNAVDQAMSLKYVRYGSYPVDQKYEIIERGADIPNLGIAKADQNVGCTKYVVTEKACPINLEHYTRTNGEARYTIDQLLNYDSVVLTPAGAYADKAVIEGEVSTVSNSPVAQAMMKKFASALRKHFEKIGRAYVGPEAAQLLDQGYRLTQALQSPVGSDVRRGSPP